MRRIGGVIAVLAFALCVLSGDGPAPAQFRIQRLAPGGIAAAEQEPEPAEEGVRQLVDTNRTLTRQLERARDLLATDEFGRALEFLQQRILDTSEDYFVDQELKGTIKSEALRLIESLTPEQRRDYDLRYGAAAKQMLDEALASGNVGGMAEVARRYFHTDAGYEATWRLGAFHLDQSRPVEAALCFERLRKFPQAARRWEPMLSLKAAIAWSRAGSPERAIAAVRAAREAAPGDRLTIAGREVGWFREGESPHHWLANVFGIDAERTEVAASNWGLARGDEKHNASVAPVSPLWLPEWSQSTLMRLDAPDPSRAELVAGELKKTAESLGGASVLTIPAAQPLCVLDVPLNDGTAAAAAKVAAPGEVGAALPPGDPRTADLVVFRTLANVRAVNLRTGKTQWETAAIDMHYEKLVEGDRGTEAPIPGVPQMSSLQQFLKQRAFEDATAGTLSSDGQRVYAIEEVGYLDSNPYRRNFRAFPQMSVFQTAPDYNRLLAIELSTGRLLWEIGGPAGGAELPLGGTFFLGPPLPVNGQLYAIGENGSEIRLYALDPATGAPLWSQNLVMPDATQDLYPARRMTGTQPAYAEGVLVCGTESRGVIAVDLARRELLWGKRYDSTIPPVQQSPIRFQNRMPVLSTDDESRWIDSLPIIADGRVILTPRDSEEMLCVRLADGEELWRQPRGQGLFVAGVFDGKVVVVGRTQIEAYSLTETQSLAGSTVPTPKPAWQEPAPIPLPSGRGVRSGRYYHLPLSTSEIATVDLASGRVLARSRAGEPGKDAVVPGNLVAAGGTLVMQTADAVTGIRGLDAVQREIAARLEKNPGDASALALRGEFRLHQGREAEALADLKKAVEADRNSPARAALTATFLEGLRLDFATWRPRADELAPLIEDSQQRARYLRLVAAGLHRTGDRKAAFAEYLKLAGNGAASPEMEQLSTSLSVRGDRWVHTRLNAILAEASEAERKEMEESLRAALNAGAQPGNDEASRRREIDRLRALLGTFGSLPAADRTRGALAGLLDPKKDPLELELVLQRLRGSSDSAVAGNATARLVGMLLELGRTEGLADLVRDLEGRFADVVCLDEKTGRALAEEWQADDTIFQALAGRGVWPERQLELRKADVRDFQRDIPVPLSGPPGLYDGWMVNVDQSRQNLFARDSTGERRWSIPAGSIRESRRKTIRPQVAPQPFGNSVRMRGHLMVVTLGNYFAVLDTLAPGATPNVLWVEDLVDLPADLSSDAAKLLMFNIQAQSREVLDGLGRPLGSVGVVTDEFVVYQAGTSLFAADVLTGDILWERKDLLRGSRLFGDREFVFVVPPGSQQLTILRAGDGEVIGTRMVAPEADRLSAEGRLLAWSSIGADGSVEVAVLDVANGDIRWKRRFAPGTKLATVKDEDLAALEPSGRCTIVSLADGKPRVRAELGEVKGLEEITLVRGAERYLVITSRTKRPQRFAAHPLAYGVHPVLADGPVWAFERTSGKLAWTTEVSQQLFDLSEPEDLPLLVFAALRNGSFLPMNREKMHALKVLDARNGRVLFEQEGNGEMTYPYHVVGDAAKNEVRVETLRFRLEGKFTEAPLAPADLPAEAP